MNCVPPMFEAAEEAATEYYDYMSDTDDVAEIQRSLVTIGTVHFERATSPITTHFQRADYARKCRHFFKKSLDIIPDDFSPDIRATMELRNLRNLIILECFFDNPAEVERHVREARKIAEIHNAFGDLCSSYLTVSKYYLDNEDFIAAESYLHQCIELLKRREGQADFNIMNTEATKSKARVLIALKKFDDLQKLVNTVRKKQSSGGVSLEREVKKLLKCSKKLKDISEKLELRPKDPELWEYLGDVYDKPEVKFKKQAIFAYENAAKYATTQEKRGNMYYTLGLLNEELKNWEKAKMFFKKEIAQTFPG